MRQLRRAQNYFVGIAIQEVDQTSVAVSHLNGKADNLSQHFV
jgi:hypothetical protein